ncbi:MAG: hypothetical protein M1816_006384 [Peltula sp. TS41687]|nr:MAG: hypothetical protein M1816_006384 [Peltula sp. TS41687]
MDLTFTSGRPGETPQSPVVIPDDQSSDGSVVVDGGRSTAPPVLNTSQGSHPATSMTDAMRARNYALHLAAYHAAQRRDPRPDGDMPWHRQGILLGVHAHSLFSDNDQRHVVAGKVDRRGAFIKRVVNYNRNGGSINPGFNGGITSVSLNAILLEERFIGLEDANIKDTVEMEWRDYLLEDAYTAEDPNRIEVLLPPSQASKVLKNGPTYVTVAAHGSNRRVCNTGRSSDWEACHTPGYKSSG